MTGELPPRARREASTAVDLSAPEPGAHLIALRQSDAELARVAAAFAGAGLAAMSGHEVRPEHRTSQHRLPAMCMDGSALSGALEQFRCRRVAIAAGPAPFLIYGCGDDAVGLPCAEVPGPGHRPVAPAVASAFADLMGLGHPLTDTGVA